MKTVTTRFTTISAHYGQKAILQKIIDGLRTMGMLEHPTVEALSMVDEFHVGGLPATKQILSQLNINSSDKVLDIGCGIGGGARYAASSWNCSVTGVDMTQEYVETGNALNSMCGLSSEQIDLKIGSATKLQDCLENGGRGGTFDKAYFLHVGMNIEDKIKLFGDISFQLKTGGQLALYDIMRVGERASEVLDYPVPWASSADMDFSCNASVYRDAAEAAGLTLVAEKNCFQNSLIFFDKMQAARKKMAATGSAPPLSLAILMGEEFPLKMKNLESNVRNQRCTPFEMVFEKIPAGMPGDASKI
jgi:SAM-dependent methyltransferase